MTHRKTTLIEQFAAASWLAGVLLDELADLGRLNPATLKTCRWVYAQLDAIMGVSVLVLKERKETKE